MKTLKFIAWAAAGLLAAISLTAGASPLFDLSGGQSMAIGFAGMIVNKESLANIFTSLKTTFNNAFDAAPSVWDKIAMKVTSTTASNDYKWLSKFPKMRRWVGDKHIKSLEAFKYVIVNEDFEATVEVERNDIDDDNLGIYAPAAQGAGESSKQLPDEIVFELVNGGFAGTCFDGQFFFDVDHPVKNPTTGLPESVSNKGVAVLSIVTQAAAIASIGAARTAMRKFKDDEGRSLNVIPNVLLVPPALEDIANALNTVDRLEDGKANLYKGKFTVIVDGRLTSDTAWFLLDTTKSVKPFVYQERKAPVFVSQTDPNADDVFTRKVYKFGAEARAAGGYAFWQLAYGSTGAGA